MNKQFRNILLSASALIIAIAVIGSSFAWYKPVNADFGNADIQGSIRSAYFERGNGTESDPFVIARPIQLYNFSWLQFLGYLDGKYVQFLDSSHDINSFLTDDGNAAQDPTVLDMSDYSIIPIGTEQNPLNSHVNGNGCTVENLTICGQLQDPSKSSSSMVSMCDVGFFGFVDSTAEISDLYLQNITIDLTGASTVSVPDHFVDDDPTATQAAINAHRNGAAAGDDVVYVGYIAGHIQVSTGVKDVYVNGSHIIGGSAAVSNFGYFGCVEKADGTLVTALGTQVATERTAGRDAGFGGSMNIPEIYSRVRTAFTGNGTADQYPSREMILVDKSGEGTNVEVTVSETAASGINDTDSFNKKYKTYFNMGGTYIGSSSGSYNYIYGLQKTSTKKPTVVTTIIDNGEETDACYIAYADNYLSVSGTALSHTSDQADAAKWMIDDEGHLYTFINKLKYYINQERDAVTIGTAASTVWVKTSGNELRTSVSGTDYYLAYENGSWILKLKDYYRIKDSNNHYLSVNENTHDPVSETQANASEWTLSDPSGDTSFYTLIGNTKYYLTCNGALTTSATASTWKKNGSEYYMTVSGVDYYLAFDNTASTWTAVPKNGKVISNGSGHYLNAVMNNGNAVISDAVTDPTIWNITGSGNTTKVFTVINGQAYYLTYNNGLALTTASTNCSSSGNALYFTYSGVDYYVNYDNAWGAIPLDYFTIRSGSDYLVSVGGDTYTSGSEDQATHLYFSAAGSNPQGSILYLYNGSPYYLGQSNGTLGNTITTWVNDGNGHLQASGTDYYLRYDSDNGWSLADASEYYTVRTGSGEHYLNADGNELYVGTQANATHWMVSGVTDNNWGTISTGRGGTTYYLTLESQGGGCGGTTTYSLSLGTDTGNNTNWRLNSNKLQSRGNNSYYLTYTSNAGVDSWDVSTSGTNISIIGPVTDAKPTVAIDGYNSQAQSVVSAHAPCDTAITAEGPISRTVGLTFTDTTAPYYENKVETVYRGSYIPIRLDDEGNDASDKNTGYIIGGTYSAKSSSGQGDIRISSYGIDNINSSYNSSTDKVTSLYTYTGSGTAQSIDLTHNNYKRIGAVITEVEGNKLQGEDRIEGIFEASGSNVYGIHFMDSMISTDHIISAEAVNLLGHKYVNYELPESCIDFNLVERGYITFLAGDYYTNNNAFFSLHQVIRDQETQKITAIKEISEIYKNTDSDPYIYKYSDGTYSADTTVDGYTKVFETKWITNPTNGSSSLSGNRLYYFEIPCNAGEYCLGSVSGKTGAYLLYLDIATNGGDVIETIVSGEGNEVTSAFDVEFRSADDRIAEGCNSVLQFAINAPQAVNSEDFDVEVNFDKNDTVIGEYDNGLYTITVTNKTGRNVILDVYLCDDDQNPDTAFGYAFKVYYINTTHSAATPILTSTDSGYFKAMSSFNIPSSGNAEERTYIN